MSRRSLACLVSVLCLVVTPGLLSAQAAASRPSFPPQQAPPPDSSAARPSQAPPAAPAPAQAPASRPNVLERPWTTSLDSPYARAQAVAAERITPDTRLIGSSPYPAEYRSPVPAPFRYEPSQRTWGGWLFPGLPFPPIRDR